MRKSDKLGFATLAPTGFVRVQQRRSCAGLHITRADGGVAHATEPARALSVPAFSWFSAAIVHAGHGITC
jgi:hypothetical protein